MSALVGTYARSEIAFDHGNGVRLTGTNGEEYLDFAAGLGVSIVGHSHPRLVEAVKKQAEKLWHVSNMYTIPEQEELGQRLVDATFADKVFFGNSGTEALECAIKMARRYFYDLGQPERYHIITFKHAFHGRTTATIAAGGNEAYFTGFGPKAPGFAHADMNDLDSVKALVTNNTAAILIEPVQGEGGLATATDEFMRELRALCDEKGMLLVLDEVQCGMGRTGKLFAHEWSGITPDIMAIAKGIGGGFPVGACLATTAAAACMVPGTHGTTYGGNPLGCAVGNAVMDLVTASGFLDNVAEVAAELKWQMQQLMQQFPEEILEVRGRGLMVGFKLKSPARDFAYRLRDHHLLTAAASDNVVRFLPPLIITKNDVTEAIGIFKDALLAQQAESE